MPLLIMLVCSVAQAGSVPAATSSVPGVLLGSFAQDGDADPQAFFTGEHPDDFVAQFRQACARKQRIWALGVPGTVACSKLEHVAEGGNGPVYALHLHSRAPRLPQSPATVLSLSPISQIQPAARTLSQAENKALLGVYRTAHMRQAVQRAIASKAIQVLDFDGARSTIYVVNWKRVDDGAASNEVYLVINRTGARFSSAGHFEGDIVQFLDVNGDGRPDVQRSISCDGICEALSSMFGRVRDMVSIYNH